MKKCSVVDRDNSHFDTDIPGVRKTILAYGLLGGALIAGLKAIEYHFIVVEHSVEIYGGLVALLFATLGIWLGPQADEDQRDGHREGGRGPGDGPRHRAVHRRCKAVGAARHHAPRAQILELIAAGLSNREIAEKLFVSENTVKTHSSRVFDKLDAKRRTQAVQIAKELD